MSSYITFKNIQIQNANCVAGLTYGFPAITHFLGFTHALSRRLKTRENLNLNGCAIVCHQHQIHAHQPQGWGDYVFSQTRNPLKENGKPNSIIEEGKMHLTVSLVVECEGLSGGEEKIKNLKNYIKNIVMTHKLAGGVINSIDKVIIESANTDDEYYKLTRKISRRLLPGFLLLDKSEFLSQHIEDSGKETIDAWLDFYTVKFKAEARLEEKEKEMLNDQTKADWLYVPKPNPGYLVPLMIGYKSISREYEAGEIVNARDSTIPFCFVEAAYGVGQWQSPHQLQDIRQAIWSYQYKDDWYLCKNISSPTVDDRGNGNFDFI